MPQARANLNYLETICHSIGLTDLHSENILLKNGLIFLVDLEAINRKIATGLWGGLTKIPFSEEVSYPIPKLTQEEQTLITEFNHKIDNGSLNHRYVPIDTCLWESCFSSEETLNDVLDALKKAIIKSGYIIETSLFEQISEEIRRDIRIGDIPNFYKKGKCHLLWTIC
jgi:hypothetical protein